MAETSIGDVYLLRTEVIDIDMTLNLIWVKVIDYSGDEFIICKPLSPSTME